MLRGACELMAVGHYCAQLAQRVVGEYAFNRDEIQIRLEHSIMLRHALCGLNTESTEAALRLGFRVEDFQTQLFDSRDESSIWILSLWHDAFRSLYRHKTLGLILPFDAYPAFQGVRDLTKCSIEQLPEKFRTHWIRDALTELQQNYEFIELTTETMFKRTVRKIVDAIPARALVFMIGANERFRWPGEPKAVVMPTQAAVNRWCRDMAAEVSPAAFY